MNTKRKVAYSIVPAGLSKRFSGSCLFSNFVDNVTRHHQTCAALQEKWVQGKERTHSGKMTTKLVTILVFARSVFLEQRRCTTWVMNPFIHETEEPACHSGCLPVVSGDPPQHRRHISVSRVNHFTNCSGCISVVCLKPHVSWFINNHLSLLKRESALQGKGSLIATLKMHIIWKQATMEKNWSSFQLLKVKVLFNNLVLRHQ